MNIDLRIEGMHCESCAKVIEGIFEDQGINALVDFEKCKAKVAYDTEEERLKILKALAIARKRGYKVNFL